MRIKNTLFVGKVFLDFPDLPSTNQYAQHLLAKSKPIEGTVISTFHQHAGRGQIGSSWESEPFKNISLSVIFYPHFLSAQEQFALNLAFSLGVREFIAKYIEKSVKVKWPNDIYVNNRKICGILIQNTLAGSQVQSCILGIGINVNQIFFSEKVPNATSFSIETATNFPLYDLIEVLCHEIEKRYLGLKNYQRAALQEEYYRHLYRYGEEAFFKRSDGSVFGGVITGIDSNGKLLIQTALEQAAFSIKEISFL